MQKITPFLWFDTQAEEAANLYTSLFPNSTIGDVTRYDKASAEVSGRPEGSAMMVPFELNGYSFIALNGGPVFHFTPATSFTIYSESEEKIDTLWSALSEGGEERMPLQEYPFSKKYGWTDDKYGLSWQLLLSDVGERILPSLLFVGDKAGKAAEAMHYYVNVFGDGNVTTEVPYEKDEDPLVGAIKYGEFTLFGQTFTAMDSSLNHDFTFTEAVSLMVSVETQEELDSYWNQLTAHPQSEQCGWLKDKYGVSWQIVPANLNELLSDPDPEKAQRATQAMLQMKKLDIAELQKAHIG